MGEDSLVDLECKMRDVLGSGFRASFFCDSDLLTSDDKLKKYSILTVRHEQLVDGDWDAFEVEERLFKAQYHTDDALTAQHEKNIFSRCGSGYSLAKFYGKGSQSSMGISRVEVVTCRHTGERRAMKHVTIAHGEGLPYSALRTIAIFKATSHQHVERLFDVFCTPHHIILVSELWIEALNLGTYMKLVSTVRDLAGGNDLGPGLEPGQVKDLSRQMLSGLEYCHAHRIIHRDLKPANLYIDTLHNPTLKIGGFEVARVFSLPVPQYTPEVGTRWYRPPEVLLGSTLYSLPWDVWSAGCILGEIAIGSPVIYGDSEIGVLFCMFRRLGTPDESVWPGVSELPDFKPTFPNWKPQGWANIQNTLVKVGPMGIDLLEQLLCYDPRQGSLQGEPWLIHILLHHNPLTILIVRRRPRKRLKQLAATPRDGLRMASVTASNLHQKES